MSDTAIPRWRIALAFATIYLVWGSTYLAIRFTIETIPPFLMSGVRFMLAGVILMVWARRRGSPLPTLGQWRWAALSGGLMFLCATGGVTWAVQHVPSSIAALMTAMVPLWVVMLNWLFFSHQRPTPLTFVGLALGFSGIVLLLNPGQPIDGGPMAFAAMALLTVTPLAWATGSLISRLGSLPDSPRMTTGMQLFSGGALLMVVALFAGDYAALDLRAISLVSAIAFWYLVVVSSVFTFLAYVWLLRVVNPATVATYAFVNPVIAFFLGVVLANEPFTPRTLVATVIILSGVAIITLFSRRASLRRIAQRAFSG
ncbi:MAG: EamA family transporter [Anaerolineae bacterium]|nr:EamA family transporter [Anaerolineae bacterium]